MSILINSERFQWIKRIYKMVFFHYFNLIGKWTKPNQNINLIVEIHFGSIKMSIHDSKYAKSTFYVKKSKCSIPRDTSCIAPGI